MLTKLENGWFCFGNGKPWRLQAPYYFCEVGAEGIIPDYSKMPSVMAKLRRIKAFYTGKLKLGNLDEHGNGIDILVANSMTESLGTVPSPLNYKDLRKAFDNLSGNDVGSRLDEIVRLISRSAGAKYLERREPGYIDPIRTPGRVSLGSHHILISTALQSKSRLNGANKEAQIIDLALRLPSESIFAAQLAIDYLNARYSKHQNHPPLIAATYNAGSPRLTSANTWNLVQYGEHIDRWVAYYNTSRKI